jgi:hypothetical protein
VIDFVSEGPFKGFAQIVPDDPDYLAWVDRCIEGGVAPPSYTAWKKYVKGRDL